MHQYVSTACQHGVHSRCAQKCKFCAAPCQCGCTHLIEDEGELRARINKAVVGTLIMRDIMEDPWASNAVADAVMDVLRKVPPSADKAPEPRHATVWDMPGWESPADVAGFAHHEGVGYFTWVLSGDFIVRAFDDRLWIGKDTLLTPGKAGHECWTVTVKSCPTGIAVSVPPSVMNFIRPVLLLDLERYIPVNEVF